jgi:hypothetical protein
MYTRARARVSARLLAENVSIKYERNARENASAFDSVLVELITIASSALFVQEKIPHEKIQRASLKSLTPSEHIDTRQLPLLYKIPPSANCLEREAYTCVLDTHNFLGNQRAGNLTNRHVGTTWLTSRP